MHQLTKYDLMNRDLELKSEDRVLSNSQMSQPTGSFDYSLSGSSIGLESEVVAMSSSLPPPDSSMVEELSDSTDGSYEIEPVEEKPRPVHITVTVSMFKSSRDFFLSFPLLLPSRKSNTGCCSHSEWTICTRCKWWLLDWKGRFVIKVV